jgi:hypothetical protein
MAADTLDKMRDPIGKRQSTDKLEQVEVPRHG